MDNSILKFESEKQTFEFDEKVVGEIDFRGLASEQLFNEKKSYVLIKILSIKIWQKRLGIIIPRQKLVKALCRLRKAQISGYFIIRILPLSIPHL